MNDGVMMEHVEAYWCKHLYTPDGDCLAEADVYWHPELKDLDGEPVPVFFCECCQRTGMTLEQILANDPIVFAVTV